MIVNLSDTRHSWPLTRYDLTQCCMLCFGEDTFSTNAASPAESNLSPHFSPSHIQTWIELPHNCKNHLQDKGRALAHIIESCIYLVLPPCLDSSCLSLSLPGQSQLNRIPRSIKNHDWKMNENKWHDIIYLNPVDPFDYEWMKTQNLTRMCWTCVDELCSDHPHPHTDTLIPNCIQWNSHLEMINSQRIAI